MLQSSSFAETWQPYWNDQTVPKTILILILYLHIQDFVASDPILSEFKAEILKYQGIEQEIESIETTFRVGYGAIEMFSGKGS